MPTVPPPSRDAALETRVFWERFKYQIVAWLVILLVALVGFTGIGFIPIARLPRHRRY